MKISARDGIVIVGTGSFSRQSTKHLHFCLREPDTASKVLLLPIGTTRPNCDRTCVLQVGDHTFIRMESIALYGRVRLWNYGPMKAAMRRGEIERTEPASEDLFAKLCAGLRVSPLCPGWARSYYGNPR